ncbi:MAG: O-antigen ligase family protein [Elusimicrobiota bacterium]
MKGWLTGLGLSSALIYAGFAIVKFRPLAEQPWYMGLFFAVVALAAFFVLVVSLFNLPVVYGLLLITVYIPFEISGSFWGGFSLSPIDVYALAVLTAALIRARPAGFLKEVEISFPRAERILWLAFFSLGLLGVLWMTGSARGLLRWGEFLFCFVLGAWAARITGPVYWMRFSFILWVLTALLSAMALVQFSMSGAKYTSAFATFGQHNGFAAFLSLGVPVSIAYMVKRRASISFLNRFLLLIMAAAIIASYSRGAWVGIMVGIMGVAVSFGNQYSNELRRLRPYLLVSFVLMAALAAVHASRVTGKRFLGLSGRFLYYEAGMSVLRDRPFFGLGPGNYQRDIPAYFSKQGAVLHQRDLGEKKRFDFWQHLHNAYLQMAVEYGLAAALIWAGALLSLVRRAFLAVKRRGDAGLFSVAALVSLVSFLVHNLVDVLFVHSLDLLFAFLAAACIFTARPKDSVRP